MRKQYSISQIERALLQLLRNSLFGIAESQSAEDMDLSSVCEEAKNHAVLPFIVQEVSDNQLGMETQKSILPFKTEMICQFIHNEKLLYYQDEIIKLLEKENIPYAILKGTSVSVCYPQPDLRALGDIDILLQREDCPKAVEILCKNGYTRNDSKQNPFSVHVVLKQRDIIVELHHKIARSPNNAAGKNIEFALNDVFKHIRNQKLKDYTFSSLSPKYQTIALLLHMERHISHQGIGLRQLCDWAMFFDKEINSNVWNYEMKPILIKCGLWQFAKIITKTCEIYLGLSPLKTVWCSDIECEICEQLISFILKSGNMGRKSPEVKMTIPLTVKKSKMNKHNSLISIVCSNIHFIARRDFPFYRRYPFILPFLWLYVVIRHVFFVMPNHKHRMTLHRRLLEAKKQKKLFNYFKLYE